jgi:Domain of unknown function (DUF4041)/Meiotically up-regulated gene 113
MTTALILICLSLIAIPSIIAMVLWNKLKTFKHQIKDHKHLIQNLTAQNERLSQQFEPYKNIISAEEEIKKISLERESLLQNSSDLQTQIDSLKDSLKILEEQEVLVSHGFYEHKYRFETVEKYSARLSIVQERQKRLIKEDSKTEGRKMTKNQVKIVLRSFNGECDAAVAKVNYKNLYAMKNRVEKAYYDLNKLNIVNHIEITQEYLGSRLEELELIQEYQEKKQEELEEQRYIKEAMREEERVIREFEEAQTKAEREEEKYSLALEKARLEVEELVGENQKKMLAKIQFLEEKLVEAHESKERAMSRAQMTRSGYVYVISNIGSFGEDVYKIGMTRRLEPMDRVKELGDASVPFRFDVHAMIYSEDAPTLEHKLHRHFSEQRVNRINGRNITAKFTSLNWQKQKNIEKH